MNDFKKEYKAMKPHVSKAITRCLKSGWYILGKEVTAFEKQFAEYIGTNYCVGVGNGMEALQIVLMALGIGKEDEIITVSNSAVATALAISHTGASPVFADIDAYYHMDPADVEKKITRKTKAILPVHLFGQIANMDALQTIAKKHKLFLIEDACQAHGATYKGKKAGAFGDAGCFSFYPTKNLGGYGDGGAITTNNKDLYEKMLMLRNYGQKNRYEHLVKGLNSRLDELQAAILGAKLQGFEKLITKRNELAHIYLQELQQVKQIQLPQTRKDSYHAYHLFVIQVQERNALQTYLQEHGVQTIIHYPIAIHKQKCYQEFHTISLPETEKAAKHILSLPLHPFMTKKDVVIVCKTIKKFYEK